MQNKYSAVFLAVLTFTMVAHAQQDFRLLYGLRGDWKFEIGDNMRWSSPLFNDSKWESVFAPAKWEDEGFPGYDGYAWYRKHFSAGADWNGKSLYLLLGRIDDVDEVYVNGNRVGSTGMFPPNYETAYQAMRDYQLPPSYLKIPGDNVIAVRVYDDQLEGGIVEGELGVYEDRNALVPELPLAGEWKFSPGDNRAWKDTNHDDRKWEKVLVPANWEEEGFPNYDGYAWYRLHFRVSAEFADKRMILLLGNIDDYDETYLNGALVGKTGTMGRDVSNSTDWQQLRAYTIQPGQLLVGQENVIAVRVFDGYRGGGIYRGPIGLVTRARYVKWDKAIRSFESEWKDFMKDFMKDFH